MSTNSIIDVHCHLFNGQYALKELAAITWNSIRGRYPHCYQKDIIEKKVEKRGLLGAVEGIADLVAYVARLVRVALQDCDKNYTYMCDNFVASSLHKDNQLIAVPLMMDIYYALDNNKSDVPSALKRGSGAGKKFSEKVFVITENEEDAFKEHMKQLRLMIDKEIAKTETGLRKRDFDTALGTLFSSVEKELLPGKNLRKRKAEEYPGVEMSPGYQSHMEALIKLEKKNKGLVFPFLAVDPRRRGIMNLVKTMVDLTNGPFYGVKLYPPLGYLPTHPNLTAVYDYCIEKQIPITVHCSKGGVKNYCKTNYVISTEKGMYPEQIDGKTDKCEFYTNPENWKPVLDKPAWKNLRINFAHFGGGKQYIDGDRVWMNTIRELLQNPSYPNLYTDLSYFTDKGCMTKVITDPANKAILNRIMFGTDYIMIMLDSKLGGLKQYYNNSIPVDNALLYENAARFLWGEKVIKTNRKRSQSVKVVSLNCQK